MRNSSTKGRHIVLTTPALQKGQACRTCKERKVRCSGQVAGEAACDSCKRLARFLGNDESSVVCCFEGKRSGGRRKRTPSALVKHEEVEHHALPSTPVEQTSQHSSAELSNAPFDLESHPSAAFMLMSHLSRVESAGSAFSDFSALENASHGSSSPTSSSFTATSPTSMNAFEPLDATFPYPSAMPLAPLDPSAYFEALNLAPSTTYSAALESYLPSYPTYDYSTAPSLFPLPPLPLADASAPSLAPPQVPDLGYFDLVEQQTWMGPGLEVASEIDWSVNLASVPFTPGAADWQTFGAPPETAWAFA